MPPLGNSLASRDIANHLHPYTNLKVHEENGPLVISRGEGIHVFGEDGREFIEGMAGLWCAGLGFSEPRLAEAAHRQMSTLPFYHSFTHKVPDVTVELAEKLIAIAPQGLGKVLFCNSGSEANDTAMKIVWYLNNARGKPEKKKIISRLKAYHGVTVASGSLTGLGYVQDGFDLPQHGILRADCAHHYRYGLNGESEEEFATRLADNLDQMIEAEGPDTVGAMFAEPVMGAGGVFVPPATYFEKIQAVLRKHDVLLIADEVICGMGRTGNLWGSQTFDIQPDMLVTAKQLSSGYLPISALVVSDDIYDTLKEQSHALGVFGHGLTYGGHPVACAVALETLKLYEERDLLSHIRAIAPAFQHHLKSFAAHPLIGEARGVGLIGALELSADKTMRTPFDPGLKRGARLVKLAEEEGLILRAMPGDAIAFCPPLIITEDETRTLFGRFERALARFTDEVTSA